MKKRLWIYGGIFAALAVAVFLWVIPVVRDAVGTAIASKNNGVLKCYAATARIAASKNEGVFPETLEEVVRLEEIDFRLRDFEGGGEDLWPLYFGGKDAESGMGVMLFATPFTFEGGMSRWVAFVDGSVEKVTEREFQRMLVTERGRSL